MAFMGWCRLDFVGRTLKVDDVIVTVTGDTLEFPTHDLPVQECP